MWALLSFRRRKAIETKILDSSCAVCRGFEKALSERHGRGTAGARRDRGTAGARHDRGTARARHGMRESNTAALCKSNGKDNLNH